METNRSALGLPSKRQRTGHRDSSGELAT